MASLHFSTRTTRMALRMKRRQGGLLGLVRDRHMPKSDTHIDAILTRLDAGPLAGPEQIAEFTAKVRERNSAGTREHTNA